MIGDGIDTLLSAKIIENYDSNYLKAACDSSIPSKSASLFFVTVGSPCNGVNNSSTSSAGIPIQSKSNKPNITVVNSPTDQHPKPIWPKRSYLGLYSS